MLAGVSVCGGLLSLGQVGALWQVERDPQQRDLDTSLAPRTKDGSAAAAHVGPALAREDFALQCLTLQPLSLALKVT